MKHNKEQVEEIFSSILKKILNKQRIGNIQKHDTPNEPIANKQMNIPFNRKQKIPKSGQLEFPFEKRKLKPKSSILRTYTNPEKFVEDNFDEKEPWVYIGPDLSDFGFSFPSRLRSSFKLRPREAGYGVGFPNERTPFNYRLTLMKKFNKAVTKKLQFEKEREEQMKSMENEPQNPGEDINLNEITSIIQEIIEEELKEVNYTQDSSGKNVVAVGAPGSVARFAVEHPDIIKQMRDWIKDCQWQDLPDEESVDELSDEEVLKGIQTNYDGGIIDFLRGSNSKAEVPIGMKEDFEQEPGDGYTNDSQRAFAHSQSTTPRRNEIEKAKQLAKNGNYVIVSEHPMFCKSTDACLGNEITIYKVCKSPVEAAEEMKKLEPKMEHGDERYYTITPQDAIHRSEEPEGDDDIPFEEGVGGNPSTDSKYVKGDRWTVKFGSDSDLKKHGDSEMSPVNERILKSELRSVIKELINEMWYGSKNDVEGDETHEDSMNEILNTYDELSDFVKTLPPEEIKKITDISKEMGLGAFDSIIEYLRRLEKSKSHQINVSEVAPPGWEGTVKGMKKYKDITNPWALAWSMKNKGMKSHKKS